MRLVGTSALVVALALTSCSADSADDEQQAVSFELPGPVPTDVTFIDPPATAPPAPTIELELLDGSALDVTEQWELRPVVLVFFESWCELCAEQQVDITEAAEEYRDVVLFVGVGNQSSTEEATEYVREHDITYPIALDPTGEAWLRYGVVEPPLIALISKGGQLVRGWPGGTDTLSDQLRQFAVE